MPERERRILVVDDDDAIRALVVTVLRRRGLKVDTARNGTEAIERCGRCRYSVVVLDLMMPLTDGYEVLAELARLPAGERPTVLVLTAGNPARAIDPELVLAVLRKPFDVGMLSDTITACAGAGHDYPQPDTCPAADVN